MNTRLTRRLIHALLLGLLPLAATATTNDSSTTTTDDTIKAFETHCASCHGIDRLGRMGPALLPENLGRLKRDEAASTIRDGRTATQMPAFGGKLDKEAIAALVNYIYTPLPQLPQWAMAEIQSSRVVHFDVAKLSNKPQFKADPLNLFMVVELGDHHATVLNGDTFEPIHRFATRFALHGGPKYSPDGRFVYMASRDGWISKFDIYNLKTVVEVRAGINTRNLAISDDGRFIMVGNYLPHNAVILDAKDLTPLRVITTSDDTGDSSRVSAVYTAPPRGSFMVALKDFKEVWEIPYRNKPGEPSPTKANRFPVRRIKLDDYLDDFFFDRTYTHLIGASRNGKGQVINLNAGQRDAELELNGMPHLGSGITWDYQGKPVLATPNLKTGTVTVIDMESWKTIKVIETLGPGFFMRSHDNSPYAWADAFMSKDKDSVHIIDKKSLEIVKTLRPAPGKTAAHVEFTRDGKYALLSLWEMDGAVVVYDATTLEEIKRIPMKKPSGKYNVWNKTRYEGGTSH